jgi:hypothetical protein
VSAISVEGERVSIGLRSGDDVYVQDHGLEQSGATPQGAVLMATGAYLDDIRGSVKEQRTQP